MLCLDALGMDGFSSPRLAALGSLPGRLDFPGLAWLGLAWLPGCLAGAVRGQGQRQPASAEHAAAHVPASAPIRLGNRCGARHSQENERAHKHGSRVCKRLARLQLSSRVLNKLGQPQENRGRDKTATLRRWSVELGLRLGGRLQISPDEAEAVQLLVVVPVPEEPLARACSLPVDPTEPRLMATLTNGQ